MLSRLFGNRSKPSASLPEVPEGSRIYAIGDIHGRLDLLRRLHGLIRDDAAAHPAARKVAVYLGDYVDRGESSAEVIDLLIGDPLPGFESVHLLGNHEEMMLDFFEDIAIARSWMTNGGAETLASYRIAPPMIFADEATVTQVQQDLAARLPPAHRTFLEGLALSHEEGGYFFAHAGIRPRVPLDKQEKKDLIWIRTPFLDSEEAHGKMVVHGHTITDHPEIRRNRIGIDTGAYATGRLTCLVLEGSDREFLQT